MAQAAAMPPVQQCTVTSCAYNDDGCHAFAITVGSSDRAHCETYADLPVKGGLGTLTAQVGACKRDDCRHNDDLVCHAPAISVGADLDAADCLTYEPMAMA